MKPQTSPQQPPATSPQQPPRRWTPPRGIQLLARADRPNTPHGVLWWVDGARKRKWFATLEARESFARSLARDVRDVGVAAYRLDTDEAREWRAFRAQIGGAGLDDVLRCWEKHGKPDQTRQTVSEAIAAFMAAKRAEGVAQVSLGHYSPILRRFREAFGSQIVNSVAREQIAAWVAGLDGAQYTRRTSLVRVRTLFRWLVVNHLVAESPCDGIKPPKITPEAVELLTVEQARALFRANKAARELCGRMALEAFAGLRFGTASQVIAAEVEFAAKGLAIPAAKMKTRRPQFIDELPANLWAWLRWAKPETWTLNPIQYRNAKCLAFKVAKVPHAHNCLRHSFASYHVALGKDASRTAMILCHSSPKMLFAHYRGRATAADGRKYFGIGP